MINPLIGKSPDLKCKYATGFGDLIACVLHSKAIGWLTYLITKKNKPCNACSMRRNAWNILFPIKFWKLFFKNEDELLKSLSADYRAQGYDVKIDEKSKKINLAKFTTVEEKN
jgi:hypothetical protein